jgi:hypothetical protein
VKHFSDEAWSDFAKNVVGEKTKMDMQGHLDAGCKQCADTLHVWQGVVAIAAEEPLYTPPTDVVRIIKSQFAPAAASVNAGFRLSFDSNLQPVATGIRGSIAARQFLFETDDYFIDLRLEPRREADRASLVGQILNRANAAGSTQGVAVRLQDGQSAVAQTSTNQLGEFQFEFEGTNRLSLAISRGLESEIVLPLYGLELKPAGQRGRE